MVILFLLWNRRIFDNSTDLPAVPLLVPASEQKPLIQIELPQIWMRKSELIQIIFCCIRDDPTQLLARAFQQLEMLTLKHFQHWRFYWTGFEIIHGCYIDM